MDTKTLIDTLARQTGMKRAEVQHLTEVLGETITEYCADFNSVAIPGFGSFDVKKRPERVATHPATGRRLLVPPKISVVFKPSALLKQKMKDSTKN